MNAGFSEPVLSGVDQLLLKSGRTRPDPCTEPDGQLKCVLAQRPEVQSTSISVLDSFSVFVVRSAVQSTSKSLLDSYSAVRLLIAAYVSPIWVLYGHICIARVYMQICIFISRQCYFIKTSPNTILPLLYVPFHFV